MKLQRDRTPKMAKSTCKKYLADRGQGAHRSDHLKTGQLREPPPMAAVPTA